MNDEFYLAVLDCTELYLAVLGCTAELGCTGLYWSVLGRTGMYWNALGCTGLQLSCSELYWVLLGCTGLYWTALGCTGMYWAEMDCTGLVKVVRMEVGYRIHFLTNFRGFFHHFFRKSLWIPSLGENWSDGIFAKRSEFNFWPIFAVSLTIFFEHPSESHPLAKIEVTALLPKEVKSSDFDQSGTIQMMKHNGRRKFYFLLLAMMFKLAINNDRIHQGYFIFSTISDPRWDQPKSDISIFFLPLGG